MEPRYGSLDELRRKKLLLKKEVSEMEALITFKNAKESLSSLTGGVSDQYLNEFSTEEGATKIELDKEAILQRLRDEVRGKIFSKNTILGIANITNRKNLVEDVLKVSAVAFIGNYAKKNMKDSSWKKKIIGMALVYLAPIALRFLRKKLEAYQKNKSVSSMEKLI